MLGMITSRQPNSIQKATTIARSPLSMGGGSRFEPRASGTQIRIFHGRTLGERAINYVSDNRMLFAKMLCDVLNVFWISETMKSSTEGEISEIHIAAYSFVLSQLLWFVMAYKCIPRGAGQEVALSLLLQPVLGTFIGQVLSRHFGIVSEGANAVLVQPLRSANVTDITPTNAGRYISYVASSGWASATVATSVIKKVVSKIINK